MLLGSYSNSENIFEIPPDVISIRFKYNLELVVGSYQDRLSDILVAYLKDPRDNSVYETWILGRTIKVQSGKTNPYYLYTKIGDYTVGNRLDGNNLVRVKFVDGEIPFYSEANAIIFNRKHQKVFSVTEDLVIYLMEGIHRVSEERCLFFNRGKVLSLYIDDRLITFQSSTLPILQQDSVLVDSIVLNSFEVNNKIIEQLKNVSTVEEATEYLRRQLSFHIL